MKHKISAGVYLGLVQELEGQGHDVSRLRRKPQRLLHEGSLP